MKVLVIGAGGREHALAWKLAQSKRVDKIYVSPGNGGPAAEEKCENRPDFDPLSAEGQEALTEFAKKEKIALTVVGPEAPLVEGIVDRFRAAGLAVIGPDKNAARLEASKVFSKSFMEKYGVRAAQSRSFSDYTAARIYAAEYFGEKLPSGLLEKAETLVTGQKKTGKPRKAAARPKAREAPLVIKADGLAAGKGVIIAETMAEAEAALDSFMREGVLGDAGKTVVLEDYLSGGEVSVLAAVSVRPGKDRKNAILPFLSARDHKRRYDGGQGPNTGGMGAVAPAPDFTAAAREDFEKAILEPTLRGMEQEGMDYRGFIFFGLMVRDDRCFLLEYNVRLGDPEAQAVLPLMESDLTGLCQSMLGGALGDFPLKWKTGAVCAPVAVAEGYPGSCRTGDPIAINETGFEKTGAHLFIAGAKKGPGGPAGSGFRTTGGRVLAVSAWGAGADEARARAYKALGFLRFEGMSYRKDIGTPPEDGKGPGKKS
ncbi:MAG: phosphoribosylamine--glycine ligase [Spirochaetaceae bacterium]|jgi:phosphoribosylamine--glycine ligase|nr:phosphoribosylamine--glycine ligase [Spirochaetaceae bacterium]